MFNFCHFCNCDIFLLAACNFSFIIIWLSSAEWEALHLPVGDSAFCAPRQLSRPHVFVLLSF